MVFIYRFYFLESVHTGSATLDSYLKRGLDKIQKNCYKALCRFALHNYRGQVGQGLQSPETDLLHSRGCAWSKLFWSHSIIEQSKRDFFITVI
jgi:hypothetical protein